MPVTINALFKQANLKDGTARLTFEVSMDDESFYDLIRQSGHEVALTVDEQQMEIQFVDSYTGEVREG